MEVQPSLDCRSIKMPIENCIRRLELDALVRAVQQFTKALDRAREQRCLLGRNGRQQPRLSVVGTGPMRGAGR